MDISALRERQDGGPMTVSLLNEYIKRLIESNKMLGAVSVCAEISNLTLHKSGHIYFSLKDSDGQIRAVMFRSAAATLRFIPENGMRVIVRGSVGVYVRDGSYQLYVNNMQPDGVGALYIAFEQLKERLSAEGLFSQQHKKSIPKYPRAVGVVTSPTGAAVRDIINVISRRCPSTRVYLYPSLVQGDGAESGLIKGLDYFDKSGLVDTVIIGRGGGSIEDLWAFNSERLARRIYDMRIPVISAVGHETDFTICDFVSDLRAPTPSAAAELATADVRELLFRIDGDLERAVSSIQRRLEENRQRFESVCERIGAFTAEIITKPYRERLSASSKEINDAVDMWLSNNRGQMVVLLEKLNALSPLAVLSRGYAIVEAECGSVVRAAALSVSDEVRVRFADGSMIAEVKSVNMLCDDNSPFDGKGDNYG